ncbi:hypothetical protein MIND_00342900 [Mycena indigotica]|uniref:Uncharacterized protein n=1 Tax=Mycena indigotica TaxID=2126181 RepID=A0A8H6T295_9AGAR|nr:uncharacterized protein MIND_00342900 [Mycena indigotica]KAF7309711.1 hypothetical protein MIND_00342900 [Mycena indigotica]
MPYPTPITHELNLLFERPKPAQSSPAFTICASPASSTSTLALDEDDAQQKLEPDFNPRAEPFVPKFFSSVPPRQVAVTKPPPRRSPVWLDAFTKGTQAASTALQKEYATLLITTQSNWPIETMAELAQNFCWRGGEGSTEEVANFAFMVYRQFFHTFGEQISQSFVWHLRECVVGAFLVTWDPDSPTSITYRNAPSFNYVASAISQAAFMGQLFKLDLVPGPHTATCVITVIKGLNSYEHIEALQAILKNAGPAFWHGTTPGQGNNALHKFVATFLEAVAPLRANMSVLGRSLKATEMRDIIVQVEQLCSDWVV